MTLLQDSKAFLHYGAQEYIRNLKSEEDQKSI